MKEIFGSQVEEFILGEDVKSIGEFAFAESPNLTTVHLSNGLTSIGSSAFINCSNLQNIYCYAEQVTETGDKVFENSNYDAMIHVPAASVSAYQAVEPWKNFKEIVALPSKDDYRPFVEEGKVWKVGNSTSISDNLVNVVDYYYFDGDTIIDGKTCKQMMCQRYVGPDFSDDYWTPKPFLTKVGAWYEENQKVYFYDEDKQAMVIKYDFSIGDNESLQLIDDYPSFIIRPRQSGEIEGFKGVYRDVMINQNVKSTPWLEGVGGIEGPTRNVYAEATDHSPEFLMSCTVGDEVIYLNDEYEDGATPKDMAKKRFDFTHTTKLQPKNPRRGEEELSLYGEYTDLQLGIHLDPLDDAYQVSITNESGKAVYEKTVNAGTIVGLSIDISAYAKGRYTVTVENSNELFTGEFATETTGIEVIYNKVETKTDIYNLQGQRLSSLQKGLNIVNGQKIYVK